jgi:hypothetical protein
MSGDQNSPEIIVRLTGDTTGLMKALSDAGVNVDKFSASTKKSGEMAAEGLLLIPISASEAARSLGLPGPVARKLGTEIERTISSFGAFSTAIGLSAIAVAGGIAVYEKYISWKKQLREELEKSVSGLWSETQMLYANQAANAGLQRASYDLTVAKKNLLQVQLQQLIILENEEIRKQEELLKKDGGALEIIKRNIISQFAGWDPSAVISEQHRQLDYYQKSTAANIAVMKANVSGWKAQVNLLSQNPSSFPEMQYTPDQQLKNQIDQLKSTMDLRKSLGVQSMQDQQDMEMHVFNLGAALKLSALSKQTSDEQRIKDEAANLDIQRETLKNNQINAIWVAKLRTTETITGGLSQLFQRFYSISGEHAKAFFYLSRGLAAAEAFCNYQAAAATAEKNENSSLATYYKVMSIAVPAAILAETFMGSNGNSESATSTYSANTVTGLSTESTNTQSVYIYINGQPADVPVLTEKVVREIGRNNGSVGGFTVGISGTA